MIKDELFAIETQPDGRRFRHTLENWTSMQVIMLRASVPTDIVAEDARRAVAHLYGLRESLAEYAGA